VPHSGDVLVVEEAFCEAGVGFVVDPSGELLSFAESKPDVHGGEEAAPVLAELGREVGGGALFFDEVVHMIDACGVSGISRLSHEDKEDASLGIDEGLRVAADALDGQRSGAR
jgi:hypothetical protein